MAFTPFLQDCVLNYNAIIVDEAQFASPEQIDLFSDIVDTWQIPVLCYGLRADFQNKFFPGSRRLMEIADEIKEIKTICWCGKKATCNARYDDHGIIKEGAQVVLGARKMIYHPGQIVSRRSCPGGFSGGFSYL